MGLFSKDIKTMDDLFLHTLQDVYYAENQIVKSLPDMIEKASNARLVDALKSHLAETNTATMGEFTAPPRFTTMPDSPEARRTMQPGNGIMPMSNPHKEDTSVSSCQVAGLNGVPTNWSSRAPMARYDHSRALRSRHRNPAE